MVSRIALVTTTVPRCRRRNLPIRYVAVGGHTSTASSQVRSMSLARPLALDRTGAVLLETTHHDPIELAAHVLASLAGSVRRCIATAGSEFCDWVERVLGLGGSSSLIIRISSAKAALRSRVLSSGCGARLLRADPDDQGRRAAETEHTIDPISGKLDAGRRHAARHGAGETGQGRARRARLDRNALSREDRGRREFDRSGLARDIERHLATRRWRRARRPLRTGWARSLEAPRHRCCRKRDPIDSGGRSLQHHMVSDPSRARRGR